VKKAASRKPKAESKYNLNPAFFFWLLAFAFCFSAVFHHQIITLSNYNIII